MPTPPHSFVLKGHIIYSPSLEHLITLEDAYLVCLSDQVEGIYQDLPTPYQNLPLHDYSNCLIIPGLIDLHLHAPQYPFRGLGMDMELLPWLDTYAFVEEAKYANLDYAETAYQTFTTDLKKSPTTRACLFATLHTPATLLLMDELERSGLHTFVGKVNMDRHAPPTLCETSKASLADTQMWLRTCASRYHRTKPILTPRFIPSCTPYLLTALGKLAKDFALPIQSHLCENVSEIEWVRSLHPECENYAHTYLHYGLLNASPPTIMAHCVHLSKEEIQLLKAHQVYVAHCPESNTNLSSGIAPIRTLLREGVPIGLGSDVAAGSSLSLFHAMAEAIKVSKLYTVLIDPTCPPLTLSEVFYLATKGGGSFFGQVGSFEKGYAFDCIILKDEETNKRQNLTLSERLERLVYLFKDNQLVGKYVAGQSII